MTEFLLPRVLLLAHQHSLSGFSKRLVSCYLVALTANCLVAYDADSYKLTISSVTICFHSGLWRLFGSFSNLLSSAVHFHAFLLNVFRERRRKGDKHYKFKARDEEEGMP